MFEGFPYTNFHELNLDWIIKIAKDFLDQYTNIQQTITQGLEDLDTKAQQLQELLDAWYEEHSQDIADQLEAALQDLNDWYTQHEGYLDQYVQDSIQDFNQEAQTIGNQVIASIPADYTQLSNTVTDSILLERSIDYLFSKIINLNIFPASGYTDGYYKNYNTGTDSAAATYFYTPYIPVAAGKNYSIFNAAAALPANIHICFYDESKTYVSGVLQNTENPIVIPSDIAFMIVSLPIANRASLGLYCGTDYEACLIETSYYMELVKNNMVKMNSLSVLPGNYTAVLPDLNDAAKNTAYMITLSAFSIDSIPANLPYSIYIEPVLLVNYETSNGYKIQMLCMKTGMFTRIYVPGSLWQPWTVIEKPTIGIPNGIALIRVMESGIPCNMNLETDIELYQAYKQAKGADYWDNYTGYSQTGDRNDSGLYMHPHVNFNGNGRGISFTPDTVTTAIQRDFSPFNLGGDNVLKNVLINIGSGSGSGVCRYAIHEDFAITNEGILIENVEMHGTGHSGALIGAGVKPYCTHVIKDCICKGNQLDIDISYHANSSGTQAPSKLVISGCYCEKDIVVVHVQDNQIRTPCLVNNNRCRAVYARYGSYAPFANMELIEWNNVTD